MEIMLLLMLYYVMVHQALQWFPQFSRKKHNLQNKCIWHKMCVSKLS